MRPLTETVPKALLEVAGQPFAHWQLRWLASQGVTDVVYCVAHLGEQVRAYVGDGTAWGLAVRYADEGPTLRGTAGALAHAARLGLLDERFLVLYGDSYLDVVVGDVWAAHAAHGLAMLISVYKNDGALDGSNVRYRHGLVERYEKGLADPAAAGMHHIDYGLSVVQRSALLDAVDDGSVAHDLASWQHELSLGGQLAGFEAFHRFYEIGSPQGLAELETHLTRSPT